VLKLRAPSHTLLCLQVAFIQEMLRHFLALQEFDPALQVPRFRVVVLHVDAPVSVHRQQTRAALALAQCPRTMWPSNNVAAAAAVPVMCRHVGVAQEVRETDLCAAKAQWRYGLYERSLAAVRELKQAIPFCFVDAGKSLEESQDEIRRVLIATAAPHAASTTVTV
jgi:hypothetical protein